MTFYTNFQPYSTIIASISRTNPGVVTTTTSHDYNTGLYVRLVLSKNAGMQQVNGNVYLATPLTPTTFAINQDTSNFDVFSASDLARPSQVIPVGEVAETLSNAELNARNIIPET